MRIHDAYRHQSLTHATDAKKTGLHKDAASGGAPARDADGDVHVSISADAKKIAEAKQVEAQADAKKVERLRDAVSSGRLEIDARAIAHKIVSEGE